jgi:hypothetical protein
MKEIICIIIICVIGYITYKILDERAKGDGTGHDGYC